MLISFGADIDMVTNSGNHALTLASWKGHANVCLDLIKEGIYVNQVDKDADTALIWAAKYNKVESVKLFLTGINV